MRNVLARVLGTSLATQVKKDASDEANVSRQRRRDVAADGGAGSSTSAEEEVASSLVIASAIEHRSNNVVGSSVPRHGAQHYPPAHVTPASQAEKFLFWLRGADFIGEAVICGADNIEKSYEEFCADQNIEARAWRSVAPHFNKLLQVTNGGPLKPVRLVRQGAKHVRVREYRIAPVKENWS